MLNIDKDEFTKLVLENNYSVKDLQNFYGIGRSTAYAYKSKWGLTNIKVDTPITRKTCSICNINKPIEEFHSNGTTSSGKKKYKPNCKSCHSLFTRDNKYEMIDKILADKGIPLACEICSYSKNRAGLVFHHIDSEEKDFSIASRKSISYDTLKKEIDKCILLCHNCHMEEHYPHLTIV